MFVQADTYGVIITNFKQEGRKAHEELSYKKILSHGRSSLANPDHATTMDERNAAADAAGNSAERSQRKWKRRNEMSPVYSLRAPLASPH